MLTSDPRDVPRDLPVTPQFANNGLAVIESRHSERFSMDWREDPFDKVLLFLHGKGTVCFSKKDIEIGAPALLAIPRGTRHRIVDAPGEPLTLYGICIDQPPYPERSVIERACKPPVLLDGALLMERCMGLFRQLLFETRRSQAGSEPLQVSLVTQLLVEISRHRELQNAGQKAAERVQYYLASLEQSFWVGDSLDQVSARLGMSRRRFSQLVREITGTSWLEKVHELRTNHAARLLQTTGLPVKAVAFECGYRDASDFHRRFKLRYGRTPGEWRGGAEAKENRE